MSKRAVVFGSSGQLGVELVSELNARGHEVHGFERKAIDITDRELVVFQSIGAGLSVREIAAQLSLSAKTIEAHREHIKEKLNFKSSAELLRYAIVRVLEEA